MRYMPRRLFGRLVLGQVAVIACAVGLAAVYMYTRFHNTHSLFYEGTLQAFVGDIARDVRGGDGAPTARIHAGTVRRIAEQGGRFAVLDGEGRVLAASPGVTEALIGFDDAPVRYFWLPAPTGDGEVYGLSARLPGITPPVTVQVAFPAGHIVFESVLHEFLKDIAWLWAPFLLAILAINIIIARVALRPLSQSVREAEAIQPGGVSMTLSERGLPEDILALVRAVNLAIGRLRAGYRAQEEFAGDMAHELRTPLAVMKAQLATVDAAYARELERDLARMERLVEQMLDRARLGRFHVEPGDTIDLRDVAREAAAFLAPRIIERGRSIAVEAGSAPARVVGGRDDLFRAVRNLIENALEHSPEGGLITIEVRDDGPTIAVSDAGPGYPEHILDAERRNAAPLRSDRRDGAGLGLSIVERTMQAHGGTLHLVNGPGGGARAEMRFPPLAL